MLRGTVRFIEATALECLIGLYSWNNGGCRVGTACYIVVNVKEKKFFYPLKFSI